MKISIITSDFSKNSLVRAYNLAKVLQRKYDVEIVGFMLGENIWEPLTGEKSIPYRFIKPTGKQAFIKGIKELYKKIDGDIIYTIKPLFSSFFIGMLKKFFTKRPLILDIDDWEKGFLLDSYRRKKKIAGKISFILKEPLRFFFNPNKSFLWLFTCEKMAKLADHITVSSTFLQRKFGGIIVYHGRNADVLDPIKFDRKVIKRKYKLGKKSKAIMFFGTMRMHKGVEDLIKAVALINREEVVLVIVGASENKYCRDLIEYGKRKLAERFKVYGMQPFMKVPEFLSIADIVVVPQRKNYYSIGQTPAKIFDGMSMAKPVIATNVSDLPDILNDCGWIVEPENPEQLAETIVYILDHWEEAEEVGLKARDKCIQEYSWNVMEKTLEGIFKRYESRF